MNEVIRSRLLVLVSLAAIGVVVAGVGTAFGVTQTLSTTEPAAEFVVSEENVTFSSGGESTTVVDDTANVSEVAIEETDTGRFTIQTIRDQPLTDRERERAHAIAIQNDTVEQELDTLDAYEVSVEPIQKLNLSSHSQRTYDVVAEINQTSGEMTLADNTTGTRGDGSVTVDRAPTYVEDRAVVRIRQPRTHPHDLKYTVDVDLANGTVTDITDWDEVRHDSPSGTVTSELNTTASVARTP